MTASRAWRRRLRLGIPTVLGFARRGFFIPYRYAGDVPAAGSRPAYAGIECILDGCRDSFAVWLDCMESYAAELQAIGDRPPPQPRWNQDWFPRLDAAMAYTVLRETRPRLVIEAGSGHSTRFLARAVADGGLDTRIVAIDPAPRADLAGLSCIEMQRCTVQQAGEAPFRALQSGDILAIDSSHILMPGTDVDMLFNRIFVDLPAGVLVHIHDIFLPDDYPTSWDWRGYNEQLGVAPLLASGDWTVEFANHYAATRMADRVARGVAARLPLPDGARESSLWLKKR
ncbi:MAG: class I SAM-dependent methyltransferase [Alphaproteobacteria bacterium]|nr:class I SAM-dependent methyltransferase [Alphaproteobacteria bacterium]